MVNYHERPPPPPNPPPENPEEPENVIEPPVLFPSKPLVISFAVYPLLKRLNILE